MGWRDGLPGCVLWVSVYLASATAGFWPVYARTFFSFAFSVCSSLPALADCRFSCFAVNCGSHGQLLRLLDPSQSDRCTFRLNNAFSKPAMMSWSSRVQIQLRLYDVAQLSW